MNKKQLDSLSSTLSKAINPTARKIEATAKILEQIEPLPVVSKPQNSATLTKWERLTDCRARLLSRSESVPVAVENCLANLTTVAKTEVLGGQFVREPPQPK